MTVTSRTERIVCFKFTCICSITGSLDQCSAAQINCYIIIPDFQSSGYIITIREIQNIQIRILAYLINCSLDSGGTLRPIIINSFLIHHIIDIPCLWIRYICFRCIHHENNVRQSGNSYNKLSGLLQHFRRDGKAERSVLCIYHRINIRTARIDFTIAQTDTGTYCYNNLHVPVFMNHPRLRSFVMAFDKDILPIHRHRIIP